MNAFFGTQVPGQVQVTTMLNRYDFLQSKNLVVAC